MIVCAHSIIILCIFLYCFMWVGSFFEKEGQQHFLFYLCHNVGICTHKIIIENKHFECSRGAVSSRLFC